MGGAQPIVLSGGPDIGAGGTTVIPDPVTGALGDVSFALLLNDERAEGGIRAVAENGLLSRAAQSHAIDMASPLLRRLRKAVALRQSTLGKVMQ